MNSELLKETLVKMYNLGLSKQTVRSVYGFFLNSDLKSLQYMNPNRIAVKNDLTFSETLKFVTFGVLTGLLQMEWDVFCPKCGNLNFSANKVKHLHAHETCNACGAQFEPLADQNIVVTVSLHAKFFQTPLKLNPENIPVKDDRVRPFTLLELIGFPPFREHFTEQVPSMNQSIKIGTVSIVFTDLIQSTALYEHIGDIKAFILVEDHFKLLFGSIVEYFGGVIKTIGDAVMAVFNQPLQAFKAGIEIKKQLSDFLQKNVPDFPTGIKVGMHVGPAVLVNLNNTFDLFGRTVNLTARLVNYAQQQSIAVSEDFYKESEIGQFIQDQRFSVRSLEAQLKGIENKQTVYRITVL